MGILRKKIKASTLMETLVATSILIIVFVVSSLVLNTVFRNVVTNNTFGVQNRMEELQYLYKHEQIKLPSEENYKNYRITIDRELRSTVHYLVIEASHSSTSKVISAEVIDELQ